MSSKPKPHPHQIQTLEQLGKQYKQLMVLPSGSGKWSRKFCTNDCTQRWHRAQRSNYTELDKKGR